MKMEEPPVLLLKDVSDELEKKMEELRESEASFGSRQVMKGSPFPMGKL
jgi:hypothetical protein